MTLAWAEERGRRAGALFWSQLCSGLICCVTLGRSLPVSESQFPQMPEEVGGRGLLVAEPYASGFLILWNGKGWAEAVVP